jgi:hypothetical protein
MMLFVGSVSRGNGLGGELAGCFCVGLPDELEYVLNVIFTARLVGELFSFRIHGGRGFLFFVSF